MFTLLAESFRFVELRKKHQNVKQQQQQLQQTDIIQRDNACVSWLVGFHYCNRLKSICQFSREH